MSLLDDVSIVVTPNGYKAGKLYAVVPETTEGSEEVTNGDFDDGTTDWVFGAGWSLGTNKAERLVAASSTDIVQVSVFPNLTSTFKISFDVVRSAGSVRLRAGTYSLPYISATDTYIYYVTPLSNDQLKFQADSSFVGSITNVSVKEWTGADMDVTRATAATRVDEDGLVNYAEIVTGSELVTNGDFSNGSTDWTLQNGWSLGSNDVVFNGSLSSYRKLFQVNFLTIGKVYKLSFEIKSITSGSIANFEPNSPSFDTVGVKTQTYVATFDDLYLEPTNDAVLTISNVSVKEVTRDNVPRIDYTGGGCPHILAEPQRTNLLTYSEDFSDSSWYQGNTSVIANDVISPDGSLTADKVTFNAVPNANIQRTAATTVTSGIDYTFSFYAKSDSSVSNVNINMGTGDESILVTNEWQRFTKTVSSTGTTIATTLVTRNSVSSYIYIWGAQLEEGSYATSYIPTSGSTVTRNQDIFTRDGIGSLINSTEGVLFVQGSILSDDGTTQIISLFEAASSRVSLTFSSTLNRIQFYVAINGYTNSVTINAEGFTKTEVNKIALRYGANNYALFINGVKEGENTTQGNTFTVGSLTELTLSNTSPFYGKVKQLQVYKTALTDTQLAALTS